MKSRPMRTTMTVLLTLCLLGVPDAFAQRRGGGSPSRSGPSRGGSSQSRSAPSRSAPSRSAPSRSSPSRSAPSRSARSAPSRSAPSRSAPSRSAPSSAGRATTYTSPRSSPSRAPASPSATRPSSPTPSAPRSNPAPVRSSMPGGLSSSRTDAPRSSGATTGLPTIETSRPRTRFPSPARSSSTSSSRARSGSPSPQRSFEVRSRAGPSAARLGLSSSGAERAASSNLRRGRTVDRNAILDRYRPRTSGEQAGSTRTPSARVGPSVSRLERAANSSRARNSARAQSSSRALAATKAGLGGRASVARETRDLTPRQTQAANRTRGLRDLAAVDPVRADGYVRRGQSIARATGTAISVGLYAGCGYWGWGNSWCNWYGYNWGWGWPNCGWSYWWGAGCYSYSWFAHPFAWNYWWWYGGFPYYSPGWCSPAYSWYYAPPLFYSTVLYRAAEPQVVYVEEAPAEEVAQVGEGVALNPADEARVGRLVSRGPDSNARASGQYLTLGDQAFRDGRYADAVHFYARAVEFAPDEGVLYLVLSDGLFATGDYHYGAFALRKALELDPTLARSEIDKHEFYGDPMEFDRQLAVLENYLADRPDDGDARLMLAANFLFGGRPAAAVDLIELPSSDALRSEAAGAILLEAARAIQYGR